MQGNLIYKENSLLTCLDEKCSTTKFLTKGSMENIRMLIPASDKRKGEGGLRTKGHLKKSYSDKPLISIVTVVFNGEKFLEEAIQSVLSQNYDNIEYIVIDGGSTDSTVEIIQKYEEKLDYWISEPDEGQSDAFIKAFSICNGEWLTWLNGDDLLLPGAINELVTAIQHNSEIECFTGNIIWMTENKKIMKCRKGEPWKNLLPNLGLLTVYGPTAFFKRSLYERVDGINKNLHYKMDTDLWWQFFVARARFMRLNRYTWGFRLHANAKMSGHNFKDSDMSNSEHLSWEEKRIESVYIQEKYGLSGSAINKFFVKMILLAMRGVSLNYMRSLKDSNIHKGGTLENLLLKNK